MRPGQGLVDDLAAVLRHPARELPHAPQALRLRLAVDVQPVVRRQVERLGEQLEPLAAEAAALLAQRALEGHGVAVGDQLRRRDASHDHIVDPLPRIQVGAREEWNLGHSDRSRRRLWEHAARRAVRSVPYAAG